MGSDPIMSGSLTLFGFGGAMGQVAVIGVEGVSGARLGEASAGGGRSLKRKSLHSGKFWFSDSMVRPDPVFGSL